MRNDIGETRNTALWLQDSAQSFFSIIDAVTEIAWSPGARIQTKLNISNVQEPVVNYNILNNAVGAN